MNKHSMIFIGLDTHKEFHEVAYCEEQRGATPVHYGRTPSSKGEQKKGDLAFLRVYKFKMVKQLTLLGYSYEDGTVILELIALGSHENFYRDVKKLF
ncbi:type II toxin-antitoxin system RelE/ParE family toxin [Alteromonas mediterranea]|uniref:type II toxin-antitoxin system RelE/ParE family toxin n=1 Tax=Alteromonas mediterranea TaxID=314275 RepID=UPI0009C1077F